MNRRGRAIASMTVCALVAAPGAVHAQTANENAVANADDAFGTKVGTETVGIYSDEDTRGFSPLDAGNARIEGVYYDPLGHLSGRLRESTTIRVGTASEGFPFHAPTGIVDYKLRSFPETFGQSLTLKFGSYGHYVHDWDLRLPIVEGQVGLTGGLFMAEVQNSDGSRNKSWGYTIRPIFRFGGLEIAPFVSNSKFSEDFSHSLIVTPGPDLPDLPDKRRFLGQDWAKGRHRDDHLGVTVKAGITDRLSLRAGLFRADDKRKAKFSEIFYITGPNGQAEHLLIADPPRDRHTTSGEAIFTLKLGDAKWDHRFFAGYRARNRLTETGGSQTLDFGQVHYGDLDPQPEPAFDFSAVSAGRVRQSALMLGYIGALQGVGGINLGIQKARYRAEFRDGLSGLVDKSRTSPWLYNATLTIDLTPWLSAYAGTERGLEDRGVAPDTAANRSEQLPATLATQYEGGLRWKFRGGQFVFNAFQITKPYFSYDAEDRFVELGNERHRGIEASLSGHFGRLSLVAGAVVMKREVSGAAVDNGLIGRLPTGTPAIHARIDANYQTDIFGGLTPTVTLDYQGKRAVGSRPQAALGGSQLMLPGFAAIDLGLREKFKIGRVPASFRAVVENVFDKAAWKVVAADTLRPDERRRFALYLTADF